MSNAKYFGTLLYCEHMKINHFFNCGAAICLDDPNPNWRYEAEWCPGERVCTKSPCQKFQEKQRDINKWVKKGKFKNVDKIYTANELENSSI